MAKRTTRENTLGQGDVKKGSGSDLASRMLALEPRILFDGAALATGLDTAADLHEQADQQVRQQEQAHDALLSALAGEDAGQASSGGEARGIVFIDAAVEDRDSIVAGIDPAYDIFLLSADRERAMRLRELEGYTDRQQRLEIRAQGPGRVTSLLPGLAPGMWAGTRDRLVHVARQGPLVARGVVSERDVARLGDGGYGRFIADDPALPGVAVTLQSISTGTSAARELQLLSSTSGGQVDATLDGKGKLHTSAAMFPVAFVAASAPAGASEWQREVRGTVVATGERRSVARRIAERVVSVVLRETGF